MREVIFRFVMLAKHFVLMLLFSASVAYSQVDLDFINRSLDYIKSKNLEGVASSLAENLGTPSGTRINEGEKLEYMERQLSDNPQTDSIVVNNSKRKDSFPYSRIFGSQLFRSDIYKSYFQPNINIATPTNYILGPRDQLIMSISGLQNLYYSGTISWDGLYDIPKIGTVSLVGTTVEEATRRIKSKLILSGYTSIQSNQSQLMISVGSIRTIQVMITGEVVQPGAYALPSLSTVFNALYAAQGPTDKGSFRKVKLIRGGKMYKEIDLYEFLIGGNQSNNVNLMDQDVIHVPYAQLSVDVIGEVRREGIYELMPSETMADLLEFCVGYTKDAYKEHLKLVRQIDTGVLYLDLPQNQFVDFTFHPYDQVIIESKTFKRSNYVNIKGQVYRPGKYAISSMLSLSELIHRAGGLTPNASTQHILIVRTRPDYTKTSFSVDLDKILKKPSDDMKLVSMDQIIIPHVNQIKQQATLSIYGEVLQEGVYDYVDNLSIQGAITLAGGFSKPTASYRVEISQRMLGLTIDRQTDERISQVLIIDNLNRSKADQIKVNPYDVITVYKNPNLYQHQSVYVDGEVIFPGSYTLKSKNEKITDILKRAGGMTDFAHVTGAYIKRIKSGSNFQSSILPLLKSVSSQDTTQQLTYSKTKKTEVRVFKVPIDLPTILKRPNSNQNITLYEGDTLVIPKMELTVKVSGEVHNETILPYRSGRRVKYYFHSAGGTNSNAIKRKSFVIYPNGKAHTTKFFLFFKIYPKVLPGSEIVVPARSMYPVRLGEVTAITSSAASIITSMVLIYSTFLKN